MKTKSIDNLDPISLKRLFDEPASEAIILNVHGDHGDDFNGHTDHEDHTDNPC